MSATETTADDVVERFCTSPGTRSLFDSWRRDPRRRRVVPAVMKHRVRTLYELAPHDVEAVCRRTEHALGKVRRADGEAVRQIVDWHPDFAFTHMFHFCMEENRKLPSYQEFREFAENDRLGRDMLGNPARVKMGELVAENIPEALVRAGIRWRVGNAYYSFLREVYTVVKLRSEGVDLHVHPLADALFRVDAWVGNQVLSLRVGNKKFRQGPDSGRKTPPEQLLADILPPVEARTLELPPATEFGRVHLPSSQQLEAAAAELRQSG